MGVLIRALLTALAALAAPAGPAETVQWDENAGEEVMMLLHRMHHAWNDGDLDFIKRSVAEEGFVGTFELTGDETPAVLNSRQELVAFVEKLVTDMKTTGVRTEASPNRAIQRLNRFRIVAPRPARHAPHAVADFRDAPAGSSKRSIAHGRIISGSGIRDPTGGIRGAAPGVRRLE